MPELGSAIQSVLAADSDVAALVSSRIYPLRRPQNVKYPAITFQIVSEESTQHMTGLSGFADAFVEVACWALTPLAADQLAEKVRLALSRYSGTIASTVIRQVLPETGTTDFDEPDDGSDSPVYWHERDYRVWYREAVS